LLQKGIKRLWGVAHKLLPVGQSPPVVGAYNCRTRCVDDLRTDSWPVADDGPWAYRRCTTLYVVNCAAAAAAASVSDVRCLAKLASGDLKREKWKCRTIKNEEGETSSKTQQLELKILYFRRIWRENWNFVHPLSVLLSIELLVGPSAVDCKSFVAEEMCHWLMSTTMSLHCLHCRDKYLMKVLFKYYANTWNLQIIIHYLKYQNTW